MYRNKTFSFLCPTPIDLDGPPTSRRNRRGEPCRPRPRPYPGWGPWGLPINFFQDLHPHVLWVSLYSSVVFGFPTLGDGTGRRAILRPLYGVKHRSPGAYEEKTTYLSLSAERKGPQDTSSSSLTVLLLFQIHSGFRLRVFLHTIEKDRWFPVYFSLLYSLDVEPLRSRGRYDEGLTSFEPKSPYVSFDGLPKSFQRTLRCGH